jgi:hypothetical protein
MENIEWSDGIGHRSRRAWLLLLKGDEITLFQGENLPGVCVVRGTDYTKNGKWSHTTYRIQLADGVRAISGNDGWETSRFVEGLGAACQVKTPDTWEEVSKTLGVSTPSAMGFLRSWRPKAAEKLDEVEEALRLLEGREV